MRTCLSRSAVCRTREKRPWRCGERSASRLQSLCFAQTAKQSISGRRGVALRSGAGLASAEAPAWREMSGGGAGGGGAAGGSERKGGLREAAAPASGEAEGAPGAAHLQQQRSALKFRFRVPTAAAREAGDGEGAAEGAGGGAEEGAAPRTRREAEAAAEAAAEAHAAPPPAPPAQLFSAHAPPQGVSVEQQRELYFLMAHFLQAGPCSAAARALFDEAQRHGLLPRRADVLGGEHALGAAELAARFAHVPRLRLAQVALSGVGEHEPLTGDMNRGRAPPSALAQVSWPVRGPLGSAAQAVRSREAGVGKARPRSSIRVALPAALGARSLRWLRAGLGHQNAVYCVVMDILGERIITGSDDRNVKIWDAHSGYLLASCRGHDGDITMLAINPTNEYIASSSNDCTVRVWSLATGLPVVALLGHEAPATACEFVSRDALALAPQLCCPAEYLLMTTSDDGSCKLWDCRGERSHSTRTPHRALQTFRPTRVAAVQKNEVYMASFSNTARFLAAAYEDCAIRIWGLERGAEKLLFTLRGHKNDVNLVLWAHYSDAVVSTGKDGTARVWRPRLRGGDVASGGWACAFVAAVPAPQQDDGSEGRRRGGPLNLMVNSACWSQDDQRLLMSYSDHSVRVWCAIGGTMQHVLHGHIGEVFVLSPHPRDPRLALSAGYDGRLVVWDVAVGRELAMGRGKYGNDIFDASWTPDGSAVVFSDSIGYWEMLELSGGEAPGGGERLASSAPVEQFLTRDFAPLRRDDEGRAYHVASGLEPHKEPTPELLCDNSQDPYPDPVQSTFQRGRLTCSGVLSPEQLVAVARGTGGTRGSVADQLAATANPANAVWGANAGQQQAQADGGQDAGNDSIAFAAAPARVTGAANTRGAAAGAGDGGGVRIMTLADLPEDGGDSDDALADPDVEGDELLGTAESEDGEDDYGALGSEEEDFDDPNDRDYSSRARRSGRRRRDASRRTRSGAAGGARSSGATGGAGGSGRSLRRRRGSDDSDEEDDYDDAPVRRASKRQRRGRTTYADDSDEDEDLFLDETEGSGDAGGSARAGGSGRAGGGGAVTSRRSAPSFTGPRSYWDYGWLRREDPADGPMYIPQLGDDVMYLWQGHQNLINQAGDARAESSALYTVLRGAQRRQLKTVERCLVTGLDYTICNLTGKAVASLTLRIISDDSPLAGTVFSVDLLQMEEPDFIIQTKLYQAAQARDAWRPGDACAVWWSQDEHSSRGQLYEGEVVNVAPANPGYISSPWQAIHVRYDSDEPGGELSEHSFWELRDVGPDATGLHEAFVFPEVAARVPELLAAVDAAVEEVAAASYFDYADQWEQLPGYADVIAVPMEAQLIRKRLESGYYRTLPAFAHDCWLIARNAGAFNSAQPEIAEYAAAFARRMIEPVAQEAVAAGIPINGGPSSR